MPSLAMMLCAAACALLPAAAFAQTGDDTAGLSLQAGGFRFTPIVVVTSGYDSNVNRETPPVAARETYVLPQFDLSWQAGPWRAAASSTHELTRFSGDEKGGINWGGQASIRFAGARFRPFVDYIRARTNARPTGYEIGKRSKHLDEDVTAGLGVRLTARTEVHVKFQRVETRWDADAAYAGSSLYETLNRNTRTATASMSYRLTPLTSLVGDVDYSRFRFLNSPARDADSQSAMAGLLFKSPALIEGSVRVGYRRYRAPDSPAPDFTGPIASATVGYARPSGAYTQVNVSRDLVFSYDPSRAYFMLFSVGGSFSRPLGRRWRMVAFGGHHVADYAIATGPVGNRLLEGGAALAYQMGRLTRIGVSLDAFRQMRLPVYDGYRAVGFLQIGVGHVRRLDRPIPFTR